jgi:hypothetical protein
MFVQVIQGRTSTRRHCGRPWPGGTSETAAREGERREPPLEMQAVMQEMMKLGVGERVFFDLRHPVLQSPG